MGGRTTERRRIAAAVSRGPETIARSDARPQSVWAQAAGQATLAGQPVHRAASDGQTVDGRRPGTTWSNGDARSPPVHQRGASTRSSATRSTEDGCDHSTDCSPRPSTPTGGFESSRLRRVVGNDHRPRQSTSTASWSDACEIVASLRRRTTAPPRGSRRDRVRRCGRRTTRRPHRRRTVAVQPVHARADPRTSPDVVPRLAGAAGPATSRERTAPDAGPDPGLPSGPVGSPPCSTTSSPMPSARCATPSRAPCSSARPSRSASTPTCCSAT